MAGWQRWYAAKFPEAPAAELPSDAGRDKWSYEELLTFLNSDQGKQGEAARGAQVFTQAQCASCHRVGTSGETMGPDLTAVARRFQRKEILESIVYPSHVISDQYAARVVTAGGKSYAGLVSQQGNGDVTVLQTNGQKVELSQDRDRRHPTERRLGDADGAAQSAHAGAGGGSVRVPWGSREQRRRESWDDRQVAAGQRTRRSGSTSSSEHRGMLI